MTPHPENRDITPPAVTDDLPPAVTDDLPPAVTDDLPYETPSKNPDVEPPHTRPSPQAAGGVAVGVGSGCSPLRGERVCENDFQNRIGDRGDGLGGATAPVGAATEPTPRGGRASAATGQLGPDTHAVEVSRAARWEPPAGPAPQQGTQDSAYRRAMTGEEHTADTATGPLAACVGGENPQPLTDTHAGGETASAGPLGSMDAIVEDAADVDDDAAGGAAGGFGPLGEPTEAEQAVIDAEIMPASSGFEEFWAAYPRRVGKRRAQAEYMKALRSGVSHDVLVEGARRLAWSKRDLNQRYIPHPEKWLAEGRWDDEEFSQVVDPVLRATENGDDWMQDAMYNPDSLLNQMGFGLNPQIGLRSSRQVADGFMQQLAQKRRDML